MSSGMFGVVIDLREPIAKQRSRLWYWLKFAYLTSVVLGSTLILFVCATHIDDAQDLERKKQALMAAVLEARDLFKSRLDVQVTVHFVDARKSQSTEMNRLRVALQQYFNTTVAKSPKSYVLCDKAVDKLPELRTQCLHVDIQHMFRWIGQLTETKHVAETVAKAVTECVSVLICVC